MGRLNYWVLGSILSAFAAGGFIGWMVTRHGCEGGGTCASSAVFFGLVSGFVAAAGVGVVVVLADRSLREWREQQQPPVDGES